jgi:hypothetical protein
MAATFVRMAPDLGKRKSVENKGIFLHWPLDYYCDSSVQHAHVRLAGRGGDIPSDLMYI